MKPTSSHAKPEGQDIAIIALCMTCARTCKQDVRCEVIQCPKRVPKD